MKISIRDHVQDSRRDIFATSVRRYPGFPSNKTSTYSVYRDGFLIIESKSEIITINTNLNLHVHRLYLFILYLIYLLFIPITDIIC